MKHFLNIPSHYRIHEGNTGGSHRRCATSRGQCPITPVTLNRRTAVTGQYPRQVDRGRWSASNWSVSEYLGPYLLQALFPANMVATRPVWRTRISSDAPEDSLCSEKDSDHFERDGRVVSRLREGRRSVRTVGQQPRKPKDGGGGGGGSCVVVESRRWRRPNHSCGGGIARSSVPTALRRPPSTPLPHPVPPPPNRSFSSGLEPHQTATRTLSSATGASHESPRGRRSAGWLVRVSTAHISSTRELTARETEKKRDEEGWRKMKGDEERRERARPGWRRAAEKRRKSITLDVAVGRRGLRCHWHSLCLPILKMLGPSSRSVFPSSSRSARHTRLLVPLRTPGRSGSWLAMPLRSAPTQLFDRFGRCSVFVYRLGHPTIFLSSFLLV